MAPPSNCAPAWLWAIHGTDLKRGHLVKEALDAVEWVGRYERDGNAHALVELALDGSPHSGEGGCHRGAASQGAGGPPQPRAEELPVRGGPRV